MRDPLPVVGAVGVLLLLGVVLSPCGQNELTLLRQRRAFAALVHPPGSVRHQARSEVGLLEGNGNHCDFFVGELRTAPLTPAALKGAYPSSVTVEFPLMTPVPGVGPRDELLRAGAALALRPGETAYVVSTYDQQPAGFDPRCH